MVYTHMHTRLANRSDDYSPFIFVSNLFSLLQAARTAGLASIWSLVIEWAHHSVFDHWHISSPAPEKLWEPAGLYPNSRCFPCVRADLFSNSKSLQEASLEKRNFFPSQEGCTLSAKTWWCRWLISLSTTDPIMGHNPSLELEMDCSMQDTITAHWSHQLDTITVLFCPRTMLVSRTGGHCRRSQGVYPNNSKDQ